MKAKKLISVLLSLALVLGLLPAAALAASYPDTQDHWGESAIDRWSDYGIVTGDERGFRPDDNMTRAEAATVLSKLFKLQDTTANTFADVSANQWFYDAINKCYNAGILSGVGDNKMAPDAPLTRETFFVMFARGLGLKEQSTTKGLPADGSSWSTGLINALTDKGYVVGQDGKVNALANINRASVMSLLDQTIAQYIDKSGEQALAAGAAGKIVLVAANNVTLKGATTSDIVIGKGVNGGKATLDGAAAPALTVAADNATVALTNKTAITASLTVPGKNTTVTYSKDSTIPANATADGAGSKIAAESAVAAGGGGGGGITETSYAADYNITAADGEGGGSGKTANDSADGISGVTFDKAVKITSAVGNGTVTLSNVTFQDNLIVEGGGSNSIKLINCTFESGKGIVVNKSGGETPRIELTGTPVDSIKSENSSRPVIIEATDTASTIKTIATKSPVTLQGKTQVTTELKTEGSTVTIASGSAATVEKLTTSGTATVTANGGTIKSVEPASGSVTVAGASQGAVQAVKTTGATVDIRTTVATVDAKDAAVKVTGGTVTEKLEVTTSASGKTASVELSKGANVAAIDVSSTNTAANAVTIASSGTDAGRIGEIATTASVTVNAANVTIDTIAVTAKDENDTTTKTVNVSAGTVSTVNASAPTEVAGSGTVADLQANSPVTIASDAVKKVTVNIGDTTDGDGNVTAAAVTVTKATAAALDVAVNTGANITVVNTNSSSGVSVSAASDDVTVGEVKTGATVANAKIVEHIHKYVVAKTVDATCTTDGRILYTCTSDCTATNVTNSDSVDNCKKIEIIPALGHDWVVDTITPATCSKEGSITYKCTHDNGKADGTNPHSGTKTATIPTDPTAHAAKTDWSFSAGLNGYHWHECEHNSSHQLDKAMHTFVLTSVDTTKNTRTYKCSVCGYEYSESLPTTQETITGAVEDGENGESKTEIMNAGARGYTSANVTIKVTAAKNNFADAAKVAENATWTKNEITGELEYKSGEDVIWAVGTGSTNLVVKSVTVNDKVATFTFEAGKGEENQTLTAPSRGTIKITAGAKASSGEGITDKSNTLMFTVPAVPDVTALEVNVDKTGEITVAGDAEGATFAKETYAFYLVDSLTQTTGEGEDAVTTSILSGLTVASTKENVGSKLTKAFDDSITETTADDEGTTKTLSVPSTKANNGKYLVVARYVTVGSTQYLDAIGVSNALALIGNTPAELKVAVDVVGTTSVKEQKTTTSGDTTTTTWEPVTEGITYYKVSELPAFAWDTLITQADLEKSGGNNAYYIGSAASQANLTSDEIQKTNVNATSTNDLYVIAVKFKDGVNSEKVVEAYGVSGKIVTKTIDDVIDEGIRAVNAKTSTYATLSLDRDKNIVTVAITDGTKQIKPTGSETGVYDDIINTLIAKLDAYKGPFQITKVGGQNGNSKAVDDLTLGTGDTATTASAITTFVHALFPSAAGDTAISTLAGTTIKLTLKGSSDSSLGTDYEYTLKFEAAEFELDLDTALNDQLETINTAISSYGKVELTHVDGSDADTVAVTITDGSVLIGTVKTAVVDQLVTALTGFDKDGKWGTVTLSDAKNAETTLTAKDAKAADVTGFVAKLKYDSAEDAILKNIVGKGIKGLDGKSVQIKVTSENGEVRKEATYNFTFTVDFEKSLETAITKAIGNKETDKTIAKEIEGYATIELNPNTNTISVTITDVSTGIGTVYSDVADNLVAAMKTFGTNYGAVTLKDAKGTESKTSAELSTEGAVAGFVKELKTGSEAETLGTILTTSGATIGALNGKAVQITVTDGKSNAATYTFSFKVDFEKSLETAITKAIGDKSSGIANEISGYATIALDPSANKISVNITAGNTEIGTVYSAVADNLVTAMTTFGTNYGAVTLKDAKNSSDTGTASTVLSTPSAVADFVRALKTGNGEETLGTILTTSGATIGALNGKSVEITVTAAGETAVTYTFSFTVSGSGTN